MAQKFTDFVVSLAENPQRLEAFRKDPASSMSEAGLSAAEQSILATGQATLIRDAIAQDVGRGVGAEAASEWVVVIVKVKATDLEGRTLQRLTGLSGRVR